MITFQHVRKFIHRRRGFVNSAWFVSGGSRCRMDFDHALERCLWVLVWRDIKSGLRDGSEFLRDL